MSYTVLAVKWRPRRFEQLVGQAHVVTALVNSLAAGRLHHAYLFAGTRGVGKTTVARILAKALNCEQGVAAEPCGECEACVAIDAGRFVDLIEVDAASRTKVDDTRELLDNVQYMPSHGRFKVYLIDEVHMLSNHSFNALLKTLEEPPPHVKFLFATTDPQKLPVTVLSRCLQFNLKKLTQIQIAEQLTKIASDEQIDAEPEALGVIARAAEGSMRDGLSLLDQAIAFGGGAIKLDEVAAMLGTIDRSHMLKLLEALAAQDGAAVLDEIERLDERAPSYQAALDDLMSMLQRIAVIQLVGDRVSDDDSEQLQALAARLSPEEVQLDYQIALNGRRDMAWCRDERVGFEMTLLRMLAFKLDEGASMSAQPATAAPRPVTRGTPKTSSKRADTAEAAVTRGRANGAGQGGRRPVPVPAPASPAVPRPPADTSLAGAAAADAVGGQAGDQGPLEDWEALIKRAELRGAARRLADHCEIASSTANRVDLILARDKAEFNTEQVRARIQTALAECLERPIRVAIALGDPPRQTPAEKRIAGENERMRAARENLESDPNVKAVQSAFDAVLEADSIHPNEKEVEQ